MAAGFKATTRHVGHKALENVVVAIWAEYQAKLMYALASTQCPRKMSPRVSRRAADMTRPTLLAEDRFLGLPARS